MQKKPCKQTTLSLKERRSKIPTHDWRLSSPKEPAIKIKGTPLIPTGGKSNIKGWSSNLSMGLELRISLPVPAKHRLTCLNKAAEEIRNRWSC